MSKTVNDNNRHGFFWHVHHGILIEWCYNYNERAEYIRTRKPKNERETRLRLFQPVKNLPEEIIKARRVYDEAWRAYVEARRAYVEASRACDKACQACDEAWQAFDEASRTYHEVANRNMSAIEALHAEECPDCPWDGYTIFPNA